MASSTKATRECTRAPKCSILLSNALGISLTPSCLEADQNDSTNDPNKPQQCTGKNLFDSFLEANRSTLHTRLNESLSEIRFAGWIQPHTLLIKGPLEELEVIKEAWRRRFLRSPGQFTIREIGTIKSVDTEIIQQAPFLPLTKAVYEAIAALNKNNLPSGQQNVFEYLALTYQYVHVPKPNVIRDSLGILFKEGKVYSSGNDYFVLVDSQSEQSEEKRKEPKSTSIKEKQQEKHVRCAICEFTNHKSNSTHAQNVRNVKATEHGYLCDKHKREEKKNIQKVGQPKESHIIDTSNESKDMKSCKKERKNENSSPSENHSKKLKEKTPKKSVWGQIVCFIKGKNMPSPEIPQVQKTVDRADKDAEVAKQTSVSKAKKPVDNAQPKQETNNEEEKNKAIDFSSENQTEVTGKVQRSRSFGAQNKKRPNIVRSNSFTGDTNKSQKPVHFDFIRGRIDEQETATSKTNFQPARPLLRDSEKSSLVNKTLYLDTDWFRDRNSTSVTRDTAEKPLFADFSFPQNNSFRERNRTPVVRDKEKPSLTNESFPQNIGSSKERNSTCAVGIVRPYSTLAQNTRSDSRPISRANSMKETQKFLMPSASTPTGDMNRPVFRENRFIKRSVSLRENRTPDCTPLTSQRNDGQYNRDFFISDSPLKHLLTRNTGNTLPVSPSVPNYIPATSIQDRSRNSTPNRNSFPAANSSFKRNSWRASSLKECDESHDYMSSKGTRFLFQEEQKRYDDVFSLDFMHQNHLNKRVFPCDCSDAGYSENYERKSVSSDQNRKTSSSIQKNERSSISSNSDNGILLDEISSSGSSEIQSIMNQGKKPSTIAKGEVVLDSSLTFIGII